MDTRDRGRVESFAQVLGDWTSGSRYLTTSVNSVSSDKYRTRTSSYLNFVVRGKRMLIDRTVAA